MSIPALLLIIGFIIFLSITTALDVRNTKKKLLKRIRQTWGRTPQDEYKPGELESIASSFANHHKENPSQFIIDDTTWRDLEMDNLFIRLNGTESSAGEETLYRLLREPSFDPVLLETRRKMIEFLQGNRRERETIQAILAKLGKKRFINITDYFYTPRSSPLWKSRTYRLCAAMALVSPLFLLINIYLGTLLILAIIGVNTTIHTVKRYQLDAEMTALSSIVRLVQCAHRLVRKCPKQTEFADFAIRLESNCKRIRKIGKRVYYLFLAQTGTLMDIVVDLFKMILLRDLIDYEDLFKAIAEYEAELKETYDAVGLIDSLIAVGSFRESVPFFCAPELKTPKSRTSDRLKVEDMYHPLISDPVANSITIDRSVLVTGSNASGKSTFLKTIATNAILAQSFHTCLARSYSSLFFAVMTSMALRDNMSNGESYFIVEIKSIKRILDSLNDNIPCLCLMDEVLRGTNTVERIAASSEVLFQLAQRNCLCIAATHDVELTFILENIYRNVHFQETITAAGIVFDYGLREGRATSRNAIKLLQLLGYSPAIVSRAEKRADDFVNLGNWPVVG